MEKSLGLTCDIRIAPCSPLWDKHSDVSVAKLPKIFNCNCYPMATKELFQTMGGRKQERFHLVKAYVKPTFTTEKNNHTIETRQTCYYFSNVLCTLMLCRAKLDLLTESFLYLESWVFSLYLTNWVKYCFGGGLQACCNICLLSQGFPV